MATVRRREKLLHQPFLVGLEGFELLGLKGDQGVEAAQARGDALLFGRSRTPQWNACKIVVVETQAVFGEASRVRCQKE